MKNLRFVLWILLLLCLTVPMFQNQEVIMTKNSYRLNLLVVDEYRTPELPNAIVFLVFFFTGVLVTYFSSLRDRFKAHKTIRGMNQALVSQKAEIEALQRQVVDLKPESPGPAPGAGQAVPETAPIEESAETANSSQS
jgi:hypothetical protein